MGIKLKHKLRKDMFWHLPTCLNSFLLNIFMLFYSWFINHLPLLPFGLTSSRWFVFDGKVRKSEGFFWLMSTQYNDIHSLITHSLLQAKQISLTSTSPHENWGGLKVTLHWHTQLCQTSGTNANHSISFLCLYHTLRKFNIIMRCLAECQIYGIQYIR